MRKSKSKKVVMMVPVQGGSFWKKFKKDFKKGRRAVVKGVNKANEILPPNYVSADAVWAINTGSKALSKAGLGKKKGRGRPKKK